jgi:hemolysin activation/secretion protein
LIGAFAGLRGALPIGSGQWDLFVGAPLKKSSSHASNQPVAGFQVSANF